MQNAILFLVLLAFCAACQKNDQTQVINLKKLSDQELLGKALFFEKNLSANGTKSCATCHDPAFAFTDGYRRSSTIYGENLLHNAPSLLNASYLKVYDWANPQVNTLEQQMQRPLFGQHPKELDVDSVKAIVWLLKDKKYQKLIKNAYSKKEFTFAKAMESIVAFQKRLVSVNAKYDVFLASKNKSVFSDSELRGYNLFFSAKLKCSQCHSGTFFTTATSTVEGSFQNIGLYNVANKNSYPLPDQGLGAITNRPEDIGKFRVPSLRNVSLTAPYMHDGSVDTLGEVLDIYAHGGRNIDYGLYLGNGKNNKFKSKLIQGFDLNKQQKTDLINFLYTLTDSTVLQNPLYFNR
jgi:cytochrome c peroxidase